MAYVAEVVGIALGLEELGYIGVQSVLLMNFLQTFLVKDLQDKLIKEGRSQICEALKFTD